MLIVEDNEANLELFVNFLEVGGYECLHAATGEDAIEIVRKEQPNWSFSIYSCLELMDLLLRGY